jgi:hypothetical protein
MHFWLPIGDPVVSCRSDVELSEKLLCHPEKHYRWLQMKPEQVLSTRPSLLNSRGEGLFQVFFARHPAETYETTG